MSKVTNLSVATTLVQSNVEARIPKDQILQILMSELNVTRSNAFVYFTKATKSLGISVTKDAKAPKKTSEDKATEFFAKAEARMVAKAAKDAAKAKNKVTELSANNKAKKVAQISAVIAEMKPQSPFAALGI
jgi:uncharacterized protein YkwD